MSPSTALGLAALLVGLPQMLVAMLMLFGASWILAAVLIAAPPAALVIAAWRPPQSWQRPLAKAAAALSLVISGVFYWQLWRAALTD